MAPTFRGLSRRQAAGEVALALSLALFSVGLEEVKNDSWPPAVVLALAAAVAVLTPLRRVLPSGVMITAAALASHFAGPLLPVTAWSAARRVQSPRRVFETFAASFLCYAVFRITSADMVSIGLSAAASSLVFLLFAALPGLVSRYRVQRRELLDALRDRNEQLLRERALVAEQSRIRERQRIAQDMHDSLGHQLTLIAVHAGALELVRSLDGDARGAVGVVRDAAVNAMRELRAVVGILGDPEARGVEQSAPRGISGIDGLVAAAGAGRQVRVERAGESRPLTAEADACAYRLVQEGLTNAHKHALGAPILVELHWEPDAVVVAVANGSPRPGKGDTALVSGGKGLIGLRERARRAGGMVHSGPSTDGGFRLAAVLPYAPGGLGDQPPLVVAEDDFGRLRALPGLDDVGVDSSYEDADGKLDRQMKKRTSRLIAWGCGGSVLVVAVIVAVGALGMFKLAKGADNGSISAATYKSITVGQDEKSVRSKLPSGSTSLVKGLGGQIPADPAGDTCIHFLSQPVLAKHKKVYRFCFKSGKLVEKARLSSDQ